MPVSVTWREDQSASQLRYEEERRPGWFSSIESARAMTSAATGLPARVEPAPLRDGRPGWLVQRPVHLAFMVLSMAGVPALAADLQAAGFLASCGDASTASHRGAHGLEMEAFLLTTEALERANTFTLQYPTRGIEEVLYALTPCGSRVPWTDWLKYALEGGVASLPAPAPLPPIRSAARH